LNTLVGNKITVTNNDSTIYKDWNSYAAAATIKFEVKQDQLTAKKIGKDTYYTATGASEKVYALRGSSDGSKLEAALIGDKDVLGEFVTVVELSSDSKLTYQENDAAKDLLNNADHNELAAGETLTAKLAFNVGTCGTIPYTVDNGVFYVKFLRPVSANPGQTKELTDATNGASYTELTLGLVDWRDKQFDVAADYTGQDGTKYNFYGFYGLEKIVADIDNATTELNGGKLGTTKLTTVTKNVQLTFGTENNTFTYSPADLANTDPSKVTKAKFSYYNNGTTIGATVIRVPLVIYYKWGEIHTSVDLKINQTINN
jgi:hypothetical protein